jgi:hypothetical protein
MDLGAIVNGFHWEGGMSCCVSTEITASPSIQKGFLSRDRLAHGQFC